MMEGMFLTQKKHLVTGFGVNSASQPHCFPGRRSHQEVFLFPWARPRLTSESPLRLVSSTLHHDLAVLEEET